MARIILLLLLLPSVAMGEPWSTQSKVLYGVTILSLSADVYSTHRILKHPGAYETNIIEGRHPSDRTLIVYNVSWALIILGITYLLPDYYRPFFLTPIILVELNATRHNFMLHKKF